MNRKPIVLVEGRKSELPATDHIYAGSIAPAAIGTPTHITNQQILNDHMFSATLVDGAAITDNADGSIDIAVGEAAIRAAADPNSTLYIAPVPAVTNLVLTDKATSFLYVDYNGGSPVYAATLDPTTIDMHTKVGMGFVTREGLKLTIIEQADDGVDHVGRTRLREFFTEKFKRYDGGAEASSSGLYFHCTAGKFYFGIKLLDMPALDSSITTMELYYRDGLGGHTETDVNTVDMTVYDDGTGTPATLGNNKYGVYWLYYNLATSGGHYAVVMGTQ